MPLIDNRPELETVSNRIVHLVSKHLLSIFVYSRVLRSAVGRERAEAQGTIRCHITTQKVPVRLRFKIKKKKEKEQKGKKPLMFLKKKKEKN